LDEIVRQITNSQRGQESATKARSLYLTVYLISLLFWRCLFNRLIVLTQGRQRWNPVFDGDSGLDVMTTSATSHGSSSVDDCESLNCRRPAKSILSGKITICSAENMALYNICSA